MSKSKIILTSAILFFGIFGMAKGSQAADWYVRPSGGSGSGTSWTAAWNEMDGINWDSVSCGDTIWVAGGTYNNRMLVSKNCTSGSQLYIRRARSDSSSCTGSSGWSSGYDSTVLQTGTWQRIEFAYGAANNYITISGRTTASGGGYGWKVSLPGVTTGTAIYAGGGSGSFLTHVTLEYMEIAGSDHPENETVGGLVGIFNSPNQSTASYNTFSHLSIHGWGAAIMNQYQTNALYEYIDMYNIRGNALAHPDLFFIEGSDSGTIRYSKFHDSEASGSGIFFASPGTTNNWSIYGNLFYDMTGVGVCITITDRPVTGFKIYNNTFVNTYINLRLVAGGACGTGCETRNNIFYGTGGSDTWGTASNNLTASTSNIFTNYSAKDFHIVSTTGTGYPRNAGTSLSSYFTTDMDGTTFGGDGAWDIGAYEYTSGGSGGDTTAPAAPSGLAVN